MVCRPACGWPFRTSGGPFCRALGTRAGTFCRTFRARGGPFGPADAGTFGTIARPLGSARSRTVWSTWSLRCACAGPVRPANTRSACAGALRSTARSVGSACSRPIWWSQARTIGPRAARTIRAPDARRPGTWAERGTPVRRRWLPYGRMNPDLIPAAIVPAPAVVPGRADEHSGAEDQRAGQSVREYGGGIVNRHIDPSRVGRRDVNNSRSAFLARCHNLLGRGFEIADTFSFRT